MEMLRSLHQVSPLQSPLPVIGEPVLHTAGDTGVVSGAAEAVSRAAAEITATPVVEAVLLPVSGGNGDVYGLLVAFLVIVLAVLVLRYVLLHTPDQGAAFLDAFIEE